VSGLPARLERPSRVALLGTPPGADSLALAEVARARPVVHVARDEGRLSAMADALAFFAPRLRVLRFPAWDCLPYDRVSPNSLAVSTRLDTLSILTREPGWAGKGGGVVITTVNAILQRVPPKSLFEGAAFEAHAGADLSDKALLAFLARNGYRRAETVREAGEYALRGGIIDLFPPGTEEPLRLDLFGDRLESIRSFDPMTQRSTGPREALRLMPVSEALLDPRSIERFRTGYREIFGAVGDDDPLYAAVSAGQRHPGFEHWLPLFHREMATLLDYLPDAVLALDHQADELAVTRFEQIQEYFDTRRTLARRKPSEQEGPPYRPLPPDRLYLTAAEWQGRLEARAVAALSPFAPDAAQQNAVDFGGRPGPSFAAARLQQGSSVFDAVRTAIEEHRAQGRRALVACYSAGSRDRLGGLLRDHGMADQVEIDSWPKAEKASAATVGFAVLGIENGFTLPGLAVVSEQDILGDRLIRATRRRLRADNFLAEVSSLSEGDFVVHADHGIGRYDGLETLSVAGAPHDCLRVIYQGGDKLYVPVENIDMLSRYGSEETGAQLDKLGGVAWQTRKARVKKRLTEMAGQLIKIAAERQLRQGEALDVPEGSYQEFCARFPWPETDDQSRAITDTLADLSSGRTMDRLVCGDVGFGKTEVALRATFVAAMSGEQVAVVVPTTLLARQHFRTFTARFAGLPVRIEQLSRLVPPKHQTLVKQELAEGKVDIVIGTSSVLNKSIRFKKLGLLVVDEEQHFGVAQKERLKEVQSTIHVLTLTATPIPRTLQLALAGVRDMSIIASPPVDRLAVRTFVLPYDPVVLREAIMRERFRGGQTFYVCPRIEDLTIVAERLREIVPECRLAMAHGQMGATVIEKVMTQFLDGNYDILLSTNIVESGLDIPTVNTIIIHRADMFGLAQLYQLRGRVGRSKTRAYAYLTIPAQRVLGQTAQKRLEVMQTLDNLGAGFQLASHDLDIRGAGNLLGGEQSGHIREVGIELYQHMLEEAVREAREAGPEAAPAREDWTPQIGIGMPVLIPESYVADLNVRLGL